MSKQYPQYIIKIYKRSYTLLQLDPANSNTVISSSLFFELKTTSLDLPFSHFCFP